LTHPKGQSFIISQIHSSDELLKENIASRLEQRLAYVKIPKDKGSFRNKENKDSPNPPYIIKYSLDAVFSTSIGIIHEEHDL